MATTTPKPEITSSQHIIYICSRFLAYALPLLLFLVVNSFYLKTYDSAQIKITITQMGTITLLIVWGIKMLVEGRFPFTRDDLVYVAPFLCSLLSGLISFAHSSFKPWASEETSRRVFYMAIALITMAEMRSSENMTRVFRWLLAAAWVAIGYGVVQYLDTRYLKGSSVALDPFIWRQAFSFRVFSTFGNPNFYGNFLVIMTPIVFASILRNRASLKRPFLLLGVMFGIIVCIDKTTLGFFGGADPSFRFIYMAALIGFLTVFLLLTTWKLSGTGSLTSYLILLSLLFLNLYSTETKGAWMGFTAAVGATVLLIFEYFLHLEDQEVDAKKYLIFVFGLGGAFALLLSVMFGAFVLPLLKGTVEQIGFQILWIPTAIAAIVAVFMMMWVTKKPWNMKKLIYGALVFFLIMMGAGVLEFAKTRLVSVSFRIFTWISTWEMIRTSPIVGNGVGTFKIIYPAYRRPQIIVLEGKSNTETDHAEDEYLEVWQDEGIVGFGIFLWMVITAITFGLKQLRWYSLLRVPDKTKKRRLFDIDSDPRSYEVLGYLGAYIGALIHWFVDVSIRFVSSGVFSGFLPGVLVAYARNQSQPSDKQPRLLYDRWIRFGLVAVWISIFLYLRMELVPQSQIPTGDTTMGQIVFWIVLAGLFLFALLEFIEWTMPPVTEAATADMLPQPSTALMPLRLVGIVTILTVGGYGLRHFAGHFFGDVHHNMAIFFSKEGIWTKSPLFDSKLQAFPPDIKKKYQKTGGALEHYAAVNRNNTAFPMAYYFTGNVYNDWGSQTFSESLNARARGDMSEAERLRDKTIEMWNKSEESYKNTKRLAPNYVQTHHQMGLLYSKRAELASQWGQTEKAKEYYDESLRNFMLYRMLDPVFPPNYDRIAQILIMQGRADEAIKLYKEGIYYNDVVARSIHNVPHSERIAPLSLSLAKVYYNETLKAPLIKLSDPFKTHPNETLEALKYFKMTTEHAPDNVEAWKGYGFLLEKTGRPAEAQAAYQKAHALSPNDPNWKIEAMPR